MKIHLLIAVIALGPSLLLIGCALWITFTHRDEDDFLSDRDDWGQP